MRSSVDESSDASAKGQQALIDATSLSRTFVHCTRAANIFASSQVNLRHKKFPYDQRNVEPRFWNSRSQLLITKTHTKTQVSIKKDKSAIFSYLLM